MTSRSPDIESLIAEALDRHAPNRYDDGWSQCNWCIDPWPCPDRLLIDALAPVYEAAKALVQTLTHAHSEDRKYAVVKALRAALERTER